VPYSELKIITPVLDGNIGIFRHWHMGSRELDKQAEDFELLAAGGEMAALGNKLEAKLDAYAAKAKAEMPEACKADDLDWLDEREREYIDKMGDDVESLMNPPPFVLDKDKWKKAKKAVKKYWGKYSDPYAVIMKIYRDNMGGRVKKKRKSS
jgi:hypothetical protein